MITVKHVTGETNETAFSDMLHYCFQGPRREGMFPMQNGRIAWGAYQNDTLVAGLIEIPFTIHLFGTRVSMLGIGGVASLPEYRNAGAVRKLHEAVLESGRDRGITVAGLHPFSFTFYGKFGFGNLGPCYHNTFSPQSIRVQKPSPGFHVATQDPATVAEQLSTSWYANFWSAYDFSDARPEQELSSLFKEHIDAGRYLRVCIDADDRIAGLLLYRIEETGEYSQALNIDRIAWRDRDGYSALMSYLWSHRGQCESINVDWPDQTFFTCTLNEPRHGRTTSLHWMARPVDIPRVLELRVQSSDFKGDVSFCIHDPAVPENTGMYRIHDSGVTFEPGNGDPALPFSLFSSLIFGYMTVEEVSMVADIDEGLNAAADLFPKRQIFMTEGF